MNNLIYLDFAATSPVKLEVLDDMLPFFTQHFGNASSATHQKGWHANGSVKRARNQIATALNCEENEIVFTSGATESLNQAINSIFHLYKKKGNHIIVPKTEHKAVLEPIEQLIKLGADVTYLDVDKNGIIDIQEFTRQLKPTTVLACGMWVNNETGAINDVEQLAEICFERKIPFVCDATQAIGKLPINLSQNHIGVLAFSAHKIGGPKGAGGLFIRRKYPRITLKPLIAGGGQERKLRGGTLNTPGIVGLGKALELASNSMNESSTRVQEIKASFINFFNQFNAHYNGGITNTSPYILNVSIPGLKADQLIKETRTICYSLGSACTSETLDPSHVLSAMHLSKEACFSSFRLSFSADITDESIEQAKAAFKKAITSLQKG
jgi:cysteine desulfurase